MKPKVDLGFLTDWIPINSFTMMKKGSERKVRYFIMGLYEQVRKELDTIRRLDNDK